MACPHCGYAGKTSPVPEYVPFRPKKRVRFTEPLCTFYSPSEDFDSSSPVIVPDVPVPDTPPPVTLPLPPPATIPPLPLTFEPTVTVPSSKSCVGIKIYRSDYRVFAFRCR